MPREPRTAEELRRQALRIDIDVKAYVQNRGSSPDLLGLETMVLNLARGRQHDLEIEAERLAEFEVRMAQLEAPNTLDLPWK